MPNHRRKPPTARHPVARLVLGLVLMAVLVGCEEDMGQDDWLVVDNRTGIEVFITDADADPRNPTSDNPTSDNPTSDNGTTGADILGSITAGSQGFGAAGVERCEARAMVAHSGSPDGPVVGRRPKADGEACVPVWVVGPDD